MKGRKRLGQTDSILENNDSAFGSKRIMATSPFDAHRAEPSAAHVSELQPQLDPQRAQSSQQHVRALNTQFASWVQSQLQNHPDELWEDGVQDYLTHASDIMDNFSDVVAWLKARAAKVESSRPASGLHSSENNSIFGTKTSGLHSSENNSIFGSKTSGLQSSENNSIFGTKKNEIKFQLSEKSGIGQVDSTSSFSNSWSSSIPYKSQTPVLFGSQKSSLTNSDASADAEGLRSIKNDNSIFGTKTNELKFQLPEKSGSAQGVSTSSFSSSWSSTSFKTQTPLLFGSPSPAPINCDASDDPDGEGELEQPSSPSLKKSEEKGIILVHEVKCKLYVKSTDPSDKDAWKDKGMGQLSIKCKEGVNKATKESKPTVVVRNDVGKVLLNALIYPGIKTNLMKNAIAAIFHTAGDASGNDVGTNDTVVARTYLIRTKTEEERNKLASAIQEYAPAA